MKRNVKELFSIDLRCLLENSTFLKNEIVEGKYNREYLIYDLNSKFLNTYDQLSITLFKGKPTHLTFTAKVDDSQKTKEVIEKLTDEYGPDQNNFTSDDWGMKEHFAWWFINEQHHQTVDDPFGREQNKIYYGIMINSLFWGGSELVICNYMFLETKSRQVVLTSLIRKSCC